jgi:hypothetical protein
MGATQPSISQRVAAQRANRPAAIEQTTFCLLANPPSPGNSASPSIPHSPPAVIEISIPSTGYLLSDLEPAIPQWSEAMLRNPPVRCANPRSRTSGPITHTHMQTMSTNLARVAEETYHSRAGIDMRWRVCTWQRSMCRISGMVLRQRSPLTSTPIPSPKSKR